MHRQPTGTQTLSKPAVDVGRKLDLLIEQQAETNRGLRETNRLLQRLLLPLEECSKSVAQLVTLAAAMLRTLQGLAAALGAYLGQEQRLRWVRATLWLPGWRFMVGSRGTRW